MSGNNGAKGSVFGKLRMGYALIESARVAQWQQFASEALGMHVERDEGALVCRLDDHARRIVVVDGPLEDVAALGYQVDDEATLQEILGRLQARSVAVREGDDRATALRGVKRFWQLTGPKGLSIELFVEPLLARRRLEMLASGFGTGTAGMGHVAFTSRRPQDTIAFWQRIFDARVSDRIEDRVSGMTLDITFLRLNPRHHSVAIAATRGFKMDPVRTRIHHLNIQPATLDDLGAAYRRCRELGFRMALGVGQHPNDKEVSFYVVSPSGFLLEYGWAPIEVDEATWETGLHRGISVWGHSPNGLTLRHKLGELVNGVRSLMRTEYVPF